VSRPAPAIELCADDEGPGLTDVARAMIDGVSEGVDVADPGRDGTRRRGLGTGLGAIRRAVDHLEISVRPSGGTRLVARRALAVARRIG
jgi:anti-sigma regulatory factor (Ser/Thr protein kinase)